MTSEDQFEAIGVGVVGMTYDKPEIIQQFHEKWEIEYPVLRDVDRQHVEAWGVRNEAYGEGTFAYGIPHPGVVLLSPEGENSRQVGGRGLPVACGLVRSPG